MSMKNKEWEWWSINKNDNQKIIYIINVSDTFIKILLIMYQIYSYPLVNNESEILFWKWSLMKASWTITLWGCFHHTKLIFD